MTAPNDEKVYLAIDPGGNTGYAWFDKEGKPLENSSIKDGMKFLDWLENEPVPRLLIIEQYRSRPGHKANNWSTNDTSQLIGALQRYAYKAKTKIEFYEPKDMYMGLRFLGMYKKYAKKTVHVPDALSALAGGVFVLQKLKIRKHVLTVPTQRGPSE